MSDGFSADQIDESFDNFSKKLDEISNNVHSSGELVQGMAGDSGLFGVGVGVIIGLAASVACNKSGTALMDSSKGLDTLKEKLDKAREIFQEQEGLVSDAIKKAGELDK